MNKRIDQGLGGIRFTKKLGISVIIASIAATIAALCWPPYLLDQRGVNAVLGPVHTLERLGYDGMLAVQGERTAQVDPDIAIVGFDSNDETTLGHRWAVPRSVHAKVIRKLLDDGARLVAYDVLLSGASSPAEDRALDDVLKAYPGRVVITSRFERPAGQTFQTMEFPYSSEDGSVSFEDHAHVGFADVAVDSDGIVRSFNPVQTFQDELIPSFPLAVYMAANDLPEGSLRITNRAVIAGDLRIPRTGPTTQDPLKGYVIPHALMSYPAGAGAFGSQRYRFSAVALGDTPKGAFRDKVVFVGLTGPQLIKEHREEFITAFSHLRSSVLSNVGTSEVPGVVLQALHYNALVKSAYLRETTQTGIWGMTFLSTMMAIGLVRRYSDLRGLVMVIAVGLWIFAFSFVSLRFSGLHIPWVMPIVLTLGSAAGVGWLERGAMKRKWAGYVSPAVLEQILQSDEGPKARRYDGSVMFGDIRSFTSFSERHSPERVVQLLNLHLEKMTKAIADENGTIDKFLGDGILAVFGAPIPFDGSARAAVGAAWRMREAAKIPVRDDEGNDHVLATGFGIATGPFLGGDVGSRQLRNWTVIGDTVNLAARLQGVTGEPDVIIDQPTYELVSAHVEVESLGAVTLKGKAQPVQCYRVTAWFDQPKPGNEKAQAASVGA